MRPWERFSENGPWTKFTTEPSATAEQPAPQGEAPSGFARGLRDPIDAIAQLAYEALPAGIQEAGDAASRWLHRQAPSVFAAMPEDGFSGQLKQQEAAYQKARQEAGEAGVDWGRMAGNVVSPVGLGAAGAGVRAGKTLATKLGAGGKAAQYGGAIGAGAMSAPVMQPAVGDDPFWQQKATQTGIGAVTGPLGQGVANAASRVIDPIRRKVVSPLMEQGISPTIGQAAGGMANRLEEKMMSAPFVGDAIRAGRMRAQGQLNRAAYNRVLGPVGGKMPKDVEVGHPAIEYLETTLSKKYDELVPNLSGRFDNQFVVSLKRLQSGVNRLDDKNINRFGKTLEEDVLKEATSSGRFSGESFKKMESQLGREWRKFSKSLDPDEKDYADAVRELQSELRELAARQNPAHAKKLRNLNRSWAEYDLVANAAESAGALARGGEATAANFRGAMKRKSNFRRQAAKNKGLGQKELYGPAEQILGPTVPDSGTAGRVAAMLGGGGAAYGFGVPAEAALLAGAASLPYAPGIQRALSTALVRRPQLSEPVANALRASAPYALPGIAPAAYGLLGGNQ